MKGETDKKTDPNYEIINLHWEFLKNLRIQAHVSMTEECWFKRVHI